MTVSNFKDKISWRLLLLHIVATFFITIAVRQFLLLSNTFILDMVDSYGIKNSLEQLRENENSAVQLDDFFIIISMSSLIGLLISFLISLVISIKRGTWLTSIFVLVIGILLNRIGLFDNIIINKVFYASGNLVAQFGLKYKIILNGILLSIIGLTVFLFSSRRKPTIKVNVA